MTPSTTADFRPFRKKMRGAGLAEIVIDNFEHYYTTLAAGVSGMLGESAIDPVEHVPEQAALERYADIGHAAIGRAAVLKLNGGLGTSMGLEKAKSLLPVRDGLSFLDIIIRQNLHARAIYEYPVPLLFMNSFSTASDTDQVLAGYPALGEQRVPLTLMQNKVPKIRRDTLQPAAWPADPELEWCPPGHGEIYISLHTSGLLQQLLDAGYTNLFISNADNLGATLNLNILGYVVAENIPFLMEVAARTEADKKGGHLARRKDGRLVLREVAQCPPEDLAAFQDTARYRYFNTNNIWINLVALAEVLREHGNVIKLPMIRNQKPVDPRDSASPGVYQLETAMGAAIEVFAGAQALLVERSRFMPVKACNDLLALRSDIYDMHANFELRQSTRRTLGPVMIDLDSRFYKLIDDFAARFPAGAPSLIDCARLTITGDVVVEDTVTFAGNVAISTEGAGQQRLERGTVLADQQLVLPVDSQR